MHTEGFFPCKIYHYEIQFVLGVMFLHHWSMFIKLSCSLEFIADVFSKPFCHDGKALQNQDLLHHIASCRSQVSLGKLVKLETPDNLFLISRNNAIYLV